MRLNQAPRAKPEMKWALRIAGLIGTTVCGIAFLICVGTLLLNYNYQHHRIPPFIARYVYYTILWGLGLLCSLSLYVYIARQMRGSS